VRAFEREIAHRAALSPRRRAGSVFFGGGTPSLMSGATVGAILEAIDRAWGVTPDAEITLEANPTSVEAARFRDYRAAGVNRVSIGVQALNAPDLAALGRLHTVEEARAAVKLAQSLFPRSSFDLIYARPGQSLAAWRAELAEGVAMAADHLSLYQLTIEPDTPFERLRDAGKLKTPDEDLGRALFDATQEIAAAAGLPAYEISNHARPGFESRHNLVYWRHGEYAGVGPGAHGRLGVGAARRAQAAERAPERWLERVERDGHGLVEDELLTPEEQGDELLLMGLRLSEGIDVARYRTVSGRALDERRIADLKGHGLVDETAPGRIAVTLSGAAVLDAVVADLAS
jgi:putative oxygen-independent coproporphyrinogen III oxidase